MLLLRAWPNSTVAPKVRRKTAHGSPDRWTKMIAYNYSITICAAVHKARVWVLKTEGSLKQIARDIRGQALSCQHVPS